MENYTSHSAQLLLYFRQSRYFSVMVLTLILIFYLYERYPTQRPELNMHAFTPLPKKRGVHILRRK